MPAASFVASTGCRLHLFTALGHYNFPPWSAWVSLMNRCPCHCCLQSCIGVVVADSPPPPRQKSLPLGSVTSETNMAIAYSIAAQMAFNRKSASPDLRSRQDQSVNLAFSRPPISWNGKSTPDSQSAGQPVLSFLSFEFSRVGAVAVDGYWVLNLRP